MRRTIETRSPAETIELGRAIGTVLRPSDVLAFIGQLGAGKTELIKGLAAGIGATERVTSPTFKLVNEYNGHFTLYHLDAYRLRGASDLAALGSEDFFDGEGAAAVEWADRVTEILPGDHLRVEIEITGETSRKITLTSTGERSARLLGEVIHNSKVRPTSC